MMRDLISAFPEQLDDAFAIAERARLTGADGIIENAIVTGLGGSGIGGKIIAQYLDKEAVIPVSVNNDYALPGYANERTLVIVSSYSGNTEETLSAMDEALKRGCKVVCITSGGTVLERCSAMNLPVVVVPGGQPPRSQFGYSAVVLLRVLDAYGVAAGVFDRAKPLGKFLRANRSHIVDDARGLVEVIEDRLPILYSASQNEGVAIRWRQQINENAKRLCWHHVYPEMNHNELVGWEGGDDRFVVVLIRSVDDHPRSSARMEITQSFFERKGALVETIEARGENRLERVFFLIHLGDWLSLLMAERQQVDPVAIDAIDYLKNELSKLP
jgi:glucose/mannose-6-phosphate isomerase